MPITTTAATFVLAALSVILPVAAMLLLRKRDGRWKAFFIGCATFVLWAVTLESMLHMAVLTSPVGPAIQNNIWLYGLYGGLAAGLFEETGRLAAFKLALRRPRDKEPVTALAYGIGHGGIEMVYALGVIMVVYWVMALIYLNGGETQAEAIPVLQSYIHQPIYMFLLSLLERFSAMILHVSFSVLVFYGVRQRKYWYYLLAVALHFLMDFSIVVLNSCLPVYATEGLLLVISLLIALLAWRVYKKLPAPPAETGEPPAPADP